MLFAHKYLQEISKAKKNPLIFLIIKLLFWSN